MGRTEGLTNSQLIEMTVKLAPSVRDAINQDGAVLLDIEQGLCLSLNVVGATIWQMLKQGCAGRQVIAALAEEFKDIPREQLEQDYVDFVRQLQANKLGEPAKAQGRDLEETAA